MRLVNTHACIAYFVQLTHFTRVGVDIMQTEIANPRFLVHCSVLCGHLGLTVLIPCNLLPTVTMVQVEVQDSCMGQAVRHSGVGNADMDIVDPAETRRMPRRTMVTRRTNTDKRPLRRARTKNGIHPLTD